MRILSGSLRQREIKIPQTASLRPTSAKLRAQVFNICQGCFAGGYVLDLFAGSGAMGIEALSQGAAHAIFVESDHNTASLLKANLEKFNLQTQSRVLAITVDRALQTSLRSCPPFSFVYIDPPYALTEPLQDLLRTIDETLPLVPGACVFLETRKTAYQHQSLPTLRLISQRTSGDSDLWHFET
jgi:16S rRNA (guanine(966)-N(2))-methyltransferase RsmD